MVKSRGIKPKQLIYTEFQIFREWAKSEVYIEKLENSAIDQKQPPINSFAQVLAIQVLPLERWFRIDQVQTRVFSLMELS